MSSRPALGQMAAGLAHPRREVRSVLSPLQMCPVPTDAIKPRIRLDDGEYGTLKARERTMTQEYRSIGPTQNNCFLRCPCVRDMHSFSYPNSCYLPLFLHLYIYICKYGLKYTFSPPPTCVQATPVDFTCGRKGQTYSTRFLCMNRYTLKSPYI